MHVNTMQFADILVYASGYLSIVFFAVCLATGLYYIAELIEEYTALTKRIITWISEATLLALAVLAVWDRMPLLCIATSAAAHVAYLQLLKTFPFMSVGSREGVASIALLAASNLAWGRHFYHGWHSLEWIIGYLLITTWLVPVILLLALAANEQTLPASGGSSSGSLSGVPNFCQETDTVAGPPKKKPSRGLLLSLFDWLKGRVPKSAGADAPSLSRRATLKPHTV